MLIPGRQPLGLWLLLEKMEEGVLYKLSKNYQLGNKLMGLETQWITQMIDDLGKQPWDNTNENL